MNSLKMPGRRAFLKNASLAALSLYLPFESFSQKKRPVLILRSSWQTVNIGDIGHTPGVLALLEQYLPEAEVRLWPTDVGNGVEEMLRRRFPKLLILKSPEAKKQALREGDFMLHGSGPSLVGRAQLEEWRQLGKPYGIYGITFPGVYGSPDQARKASPQDISLLNQARFVYFRDSVSLEIARELGITCPIMDFAPDGAFAVDVKNEAAATRFLKAHGLEEKKFLCVLPRYRYTPWWKMPSKNANLDPRRDRINQQMKEQDHAPIREAIIALARQTTMKVLICPEDETQVAIGKEMLYDPLPDDVKAKVVWRDRYWLTDEAVSTYARAAGMFGLEMHSPIMAMAQGVPAIVCRFAEQTHKGFMWKDIGLGSWLFDMDMPADVAAIVPAVLAMAQDPAAARKKARKAHKLVQQKQKATMAVLRQALVDKA